MLGAGGMGQVYEGMDETLECKVAVKVLLRKLADEQKFRGRFLREARAASKVRHPNVVKITDFGEHTDGSVFFVMEYLEGRDLQQLLRAQQRLPWARARHILLQIVSAIGATHDRNIVHRDIKPANFFLVDARGHRDFIKLLDSGIAKLATEPSEDDKGLALSLTGTGEVFGTAKYMAPEVAYGETKDPRIDIYAVGVVAYEMLTGRVPFEGSSVFEILKKHVDEPPRPLRAIDPGIPAEVEAMVLRALAKQPDERFGSMDELEAAISALPEDLQTAPVAVPSRRQRLRRTVPLATPAEDADPPGDGVPVPRSAVDTEPARAADPSAGSKAEAEGEETTNVAPRAGAPVAVVVAARQVPEAV
ncbi:MAG: serine/threonine protein kinase [Myxococcales bacterium]|nr:serine/threonine protein kinase [Myxococcales bacterium]